MVLLASGAANATVINFSATGQTGQGSFFVGAGNATAESITTGGYTVLLSGGVYLGPNITNLPADTGVIYGTADFANTLGQSGYTNPLTIQFFQAGTSTPATVNNFFVDVLNGNTVNVDYTLADNLGNSLMFNLAPNLSGGRKTVGFAAAGNTITITGGPAVNGCCQWDFFIDNLGFNEPLPTGSTSGGVSPVPIPAAAWLFGSGLLGLIGVARRRSPLRGTHTNGTTLRPPQAKLRHASES